MVIDGVAGHVTRDVRAARAIGDEVAAVLQIGHRDLLVVGGMSSDRSIQLDMVRMRARRTPKPVGRILASRPCAVNQGGGDGGEIIRRRATRR